MSIAQRLVRIAKPVVQRLPYALIAYRRVRDRLGALRKMTETPMGFKFIGTPAMERGVFEPEETRLFQMLLRHAEIFVNVGANVGYYCCLALQRQKYTVACEPIEQNLEYLYRNITSNHWQNMIEVFPVALSDCIGIIDIFGSGTSASLIQGWAGAFAQDAKLVSALTLDVLLGARFSGQQLLVLVDIEGSELFMLQGAKTVLARVPKPMWMVEIAVSEHQTRGIAVNPYLTKTFEFFWDHGYQAWTADESLRLITPVEIDAIAHSGKDTLGTHNFVFLECGKKDALFLENAHVIAQT
jgi:FkbM family methyltransferase